MPLKETRDVIHLRAVQDIARQRFHFPTSEFPTFRTAVNRPEPVMPAGRGARGEGFYPDIVVYSEPRKEVQMVAEVETASSVTYDEALHDWLRFSELGAPFYLYVPAGMVPPTQRILKRLGIKNCQLRTWRYIHGLKTLDITEVTYLRPGLEALVPPILLRLLGGHGGGDRAQPQSETGVDEVREPSGAGPDAG